MCQPTYRLSVEIDYLYQPGSARESLAYLLFLTEITYLWELGNWYIHAENIRLLIYTHQVQC